MAARARTGPTWPRVPRREARAHGLGVGDRGDGRLEELGLEVGVGSPDAGPKFCAAMNCLGRA